jgi:hypothetical protein
MIKALPACLAANYNSQTVGLIVEIKAGRLTCVFKRATFPGL